MALLLMSRMIRRQYHISSLPADAHLRRLLPAWRGVVRSPAAAQLRAMSTPRPVWNEHFLQRIQHLLARDDLNWGSRAPIPDTPEWVTPEVVTGGFASGSLIASGPLLQFEQEVADRLGMGAATSAWGEDADRTSLNAHFLTEQGLEELQQRLATGCFRIEVPEEGALLAMTWLLGQGRQQEACQLLETLAPWFGRLRFYPRPADQALPLRQGLVHLRTVDETRSTLSKKHVPPHVVLQERAFAVWRPLLDDVMTLILETMRAPPYLVRDSLGQPFNGLTGLWAVAGGFPGEVYPEGWDGRAAALLQRAGSGALPTAKRHRLVRALGLLRSMVQRGAPGVPGPDAPGAARERAAMRTSLACWMQQRGPPGSPQLQRAAAFDARKVSDLRRLLLATQGLLESLAPFPGDAGCPATLEEVVGPALGSDQSPLTHSLKRKVLRCLDLPLEQHLQLGTIPSAEVLAAVLPQLSSGVAAASMAARAAALGAGGAEEERRAVVERLLAALYSSFRRRRSLLLLDFESQVRFEELPWVAALTQPHVPGERSRAGPPQAGPAGAQAADSEAAAASLQLLKHVALLLLRRFPGSLLPNKLLQELAALARAAGLPHQQLPLVDELAADIFMGKFAPKFTAAAHIAGRLRQGSLYARYYAIEYQEVLDMPVLESVRKGGEGDLFSQLCKRRAAAGGAEGSHWGSWVTGNGRVIEQGQILTTHNLAALVSVLELGAEQLQPRALAEGAWRTAVRLVVRARQAGAGWKVQLQGVKNAAYAWRNMVFFLSLLPPGDQAEFMQWAAEQLLRPRLDAATGEVLQEALRGLREAAAAAGSAAAARGDAGEGETHGGAARQVLGWISGGGHWMLAGVQRPISLWSNYEDEDASTAAHGGHDSDEGHDEGNHVDGASSDDDGADKEEVEDKEGGEGKEKD